MKQLVFTEPKDAFHREGLMNTCRKGEFWGRMEGKIVELVDSDKNHLGYGCIEKTIIKPFFEITEEDVKDNPIPEIPKLYWKLKEVYGMFCPQDNVTLVYFKRVEEKGK